jgi:hypothetical protein
MWRIEAGKAVPVERSALANEQLLEDILDENISLLGLPNQLLVVGRQVVTEYSGRVDLLCVDQEGTLYVVEIKKERTPREVVAQAMDYGYWVRDLDYDEIRDIYARYRPGGDFDEAFRQAFQEEPPETINAEHQLVIVASALDPASERIVIYAQRLGVPVNVVFFQTFQQDGAQLLTRAWLIDPVEETTVRTGPGKKQKAPWNGKDWYVGFGEDEARSWEDARAYGFVSAGGGPWYSRTLKKLPVDGRVFVNLPGRGYVGVGVVTGHAVPARDFKVTHDEQELRLLDAPHHASGLEQRAALEDDETEWIVPIRWLKAIPANEAITFKGKYGNQNIATRLTHALTRETVLEGLGLTEEALDEAQPT